MAESFSLSKRLNSITTPAFVAPALLVAGLLSGCPGEVLHYGLTVGEICDDGIDNDGDGQIDCLQPSCSQQQACQEVATKPSVDPPWPSCANIEADRSTTPIDLIWVVDSSPSMVEEMGAIQKNLSDFVSYLTGIKLDIRVILLGGEQICAPEPLSGPDCADGPNYRHISDYVGSHDSLQKVIEFYPRYRDFLRPEGRKAIIVTTDDNSEVTAEWFTDQLQILEQPGFGQDYVIHSIVAYGTHPRGCFTAAAAGSVYLRLTDSTEGIKHPVCEKDWTRIFSELANGVIGMVELPCAYKVPSMPPGKVPVESQIHVTYFDGAQRQLLPRLAGVTGCDQQPGWFFEGAAQTVRLCPAVCSGAAAADVKVDFGCTDNVN